MLVIIPLPLLAHTLQLPLQEARMKNTIQITSEMINEMETEISRMMITLQKLKSRVSRDDLTGLLRRDEFFYRMNRMMETSQGGNMAIIMIDVDNFKEINDSEGHVVGDHILQRISKVIQRCQKVGAEVGRFGGEEFILAVAATKDSARIMAEALRRQIQREVNVTVSVGVATAKAANWEIRRMVGMADEALYQAKHTGKNRVCLAA